MSTYLPSTAHPPGLPTDPAPTYSAYEMRPLRTDAERAEAAALVTDRLNWLAHRCPPQAGVATVPQLFREASVPDAVGLFDAGILICCLMVDRHPDTRRWGNADRGPALLLRYVHSLPGQGGARVARLLTMWAADYAARNELAWVRIEALLAARADQPAEVVAHLIAYITNTGWTTHGSAANSFGERVARLHRPAERIPNLTNAIRCTVPLPFTTERSTP